MFNKDLGEKLLAVQEALVYKLMSVNGSEERYGATYLLAPSTLSYIPGVNSLNELAMFLAYTQLPEGKRIESLVKNPLGLIKTKDGKNYVGALSAQEHTELTKLFANRPESKPGDLVQPEDSNQELAEFASPFSHRLGEWIISKAEGLIDLELNDEGLIDLTDGKY